MSFRSENTPLSRRSVRDNSRVESYAEFATSPAPRTPPATPRYIQEMNVHQDFFLYIPGLRTCQRVEIAARQLYANHRFTFSKFIHAWASEPNSPNATTTESRASELAKAVLTSDPALDALANELKRDERACARLMPILTEQIRQELSGVEKIKGMGKYDVNLDPETFDLANLKYRVWDALPVFLSFILSIVNFGKKSNARVASRRNFAAQFLTIVTVLSHFMRVINSSIFNNALAIYFYTLGIKRRALSVLHGMGLVPVFSTVVGYSASIANNAAVSLRSHFFAIATAYAIQAMIKEVAKNHRNQLVIVWDNFDFTETVHYESLSKPSQHFSATTGLMVHSQHIPAEGIRLTEFNSEIPLDPSVFYYAPGNSEDETQYQARLYFFFEAIRYTHPGVIDKIFGANSSSRPCFPHKQCLEPNKTVRYEMGPIMENENSVSGTLSVMNHILLQVLGYDIEDPEFGQYIQLTYGDQKTVSLVQSVKRMRKYSEHVYERFQSFLPIPGLFHYKMNFIDLIFSHFSGKGEQQRCPSSVKHNEHHMGIAKGNVLPFHHKEQVLTRCFDARVLAMLYDNIQDSTEVDTTDVDEIEEYLQTLTPDEFLEKLSSMVRHTFSKEALSPFNTNDTSVDQTHRVSCQFLDVMVTYRELKHAIKFGDIGYLKRLFPRIAMIFAGSNKTKYCGITLYMTWLLETEAASQTLKHAILANSLVNTSGRKDGFYEIDRLNEFTNYRLRLLMKSRSSNEELKDLFRRMALSSAYTAIVKEGLEELCGERTNSTHHPKDISEDIYQLAHHLHTEGVVRYVPSGRECDLRVTNLVYKGLDVLEDQINNFNDRFIEDDDEDDEHALDSEEDNPDGEYFQTGSEQIQDTATVQLGDFSDIINPNELATLAELALTQS